MATSPESAHAERPPLIRFGEFQLDLQTGELSRNGTKNRLQGQPLQLLELLLRHPGQLVTREQIQQHLWPDGTVVEFEHSVNAAVKRLREALDDNAENPTFIETIPRRGYRFIVRAFDVPFANAPASVVENKPVPASEIAHPAIPGASAPSIKKRFSRVGVLCAALAVVAAVSATVVLYRGGGADHKPPAIKSLAVLPLKNLSGDPAQEYLADGMTEELIGRLSMIRDLRVISRTSVMRFKDTKLSVPEIAKALGVDAIVEGSVMRESDRIRVHAQLIRAATDEHFWSEAYDQQLRDVLTLQSEVAQSIAKKVEVTVTGEEHSRLTAARPVSPEVYDIYLKGKDEFVKGRNRAGFEKSIAHFQDAIEKDAMFAPAYVGMAAAYIRLGTNLVGASPDEAWPKAISAARKALELDPGQAEPHALLAEAYQRQWQWSEAETELQRALELDPNDVDAHLGFARWLLCHGRIDEALAWSERAGKLDPFGIPNVLHPWILIHARRYGEAIRELRTVLVAAPDLAVAHWHLGYALVANGQPDEAIPTLEKARDLTGGSPAVLGVLVRAYADAGRRADALRFLAELKQRQQTAYVPPAAFVNAYLGLGENEQALAWLEKGFKGRSSMLAFLKVDPYFDPLRGDPRFKDLVHRVGLD